LVLHTKQKYNQNILDKPGNELFFMDCTPSDYYKNTAYLILKNRRG